jgi:uncharacterized membrane protein YphA (DoxX/SURF4 family)
MLSLIKGKLSVKELKGGYGFFVISSRCLEITPQCREGKLSEENRRLSRNPGGAIFNRNIFISPPVSLIMVLGLSLAVVAILIIAILLLYGFMKHKFFALFLIALLLFSFFTFNAAFNSKKISVNNLSDLGKTFKVYFSWFGNLFGNIKSITADAVKMDWNGNQTT